MINDIYMPFPLPELPEIPDRAISITEHGAVSGGKTLNTDAITAAIKTISTLGGGRVVVPAGVWLTGPIHLRSRIELHLEEGAEVLFEERAEAHLPVVYMQRTGVSCYGFSPCIYAYDCEDIAVTGSGTFNGQGEWWWRWRMENKGVPVVSPQGGNLQTMGARGVPIAQRVFDRYETGFRPPFFQTLQCRRVLVQGVTFTRSPSWTVHPVLCEELTIQGIRVLNPGREAPNTDGINPDACRNVLVEHCEISTGDDGICLKAGRDQEAWERGVPLENALIRNCKVQAAHGGFVIGSEMSGGVRNVCVHDCFFDGTDVGIRIKPRPGRGGCIHNIKVYNIHMRDIAREAILLTQYSPFYKGGYEYDKLKAVPDVRQVRITDIVCDSAGASITIRGLPGYPFRDLVFENIEITADSAMHIEEVANLAMNNVRIQQDPMRFC